MLYAPHHRRRHRRFDPVGASLRRLDPAHRQPGVERLPRRARRRRRRSARAELGRAAADDAPAWAVEALGPVPDDRDRARRVGGARRRRRRLPRAARPRRRRPTRSAPAPQGRAGRAVRRLPRRLARPRPPGGRPRQPRAVRRPAAHARPRAGSASKPGGPATSATSSPAPARPPPTTARPPPCAAPKPTPPTATTPSAPGCTGRPPRPRPSPRPSTSAPPQLQELDDARAALARPHRRAPAPTPNDAEAMLAERHADDAEPEPVVTAEEWLAAHRAAVADDERHPRDHRGRRRRGRRRARPDVDARPSAADADAGRHPRDRRGRAARRPRGRRARALGRRGRRLGRPRAAGPWPRSAPATRPTSTPPSTNAPPQLARWHDDDHATERTGGRRRGRPRVRRQRAEPVTGRPSARSAP